MAYLPAPLQRLLARPESERRIGPFVLVEQLGRGGFAPVWLAREIYGDTLVRTAALKLFPFDDEDARRRAELREHIAAEARALCQVEHPNVVRFYAMPVDPEAGVIGLAMEHVEGRSLAARLADGRPSIADVIAVGIATASALAAVHAKGLVHRDVKPANVVDAGGVYKLIDFGIAAADVVDASGRLVAVAGSSDRAAEHRTSASPGRDATPTTPIGRFVGTLGYADPACVATGARPDARSDLYGLGATLFECLTGAQPAAALAPAGVGRRRDVLDGSARPPSLRELVPSAPGDLLELVDAMLSPDPRDRPASAEWVAARLEQIRRDVGGGHRALPPESVGPFRGLGRFQADDRDVYFGRSVEVGAAIEVLRSRGLVALVGPSGSGKSSLARAGIVPSIEDGALGAWPAAWDVVVLEPGSDPDGALAAALTPLVPGAADRSAELLHAALTERAHTTGRGVAIVVDQLEEIGTVAETGRAARLAGLLGCVGARAVPGVRAIVTARRDLLDPLLAFGPLGRAVLRGSVLIEPITEFTWATVIERALAAYGHRFEDEALRAQIFAEIKPIAGAMPLVMFALTELWDQRDVGAKTITRAAFQATGGIAGALERHAEATLAELVEERGSAEAGTKAMLLALTTPQGTRSVRRRADVERATGEGGNEMLQAFERARLITEGPEGVTLAHEELLARWARLRAWVAEAREDRVLLDELENDAARWRASPETAPLWRTQRLAFWEALALRGAAMPSAYALPFLKASRAAERRGRVVAAGAIAAVITAIAVSGAAYVRAVKTEQVKTAAALQNEHESRALAEETTRDVQRAQGEIDRLLKAMADSPSKETVLDLQRQIRAGKVDDHDEARSATRAPARPAGSARSTAANATTVTKGLVVETEW